MIIEEIKTSDQLAREAALNPRQSFIVQAPAGSGKTELLTQRYLSLLAQACESPEEIIALTFTRKAAAQMRERILLALQLALKPQPLATGHQLTSWELARQVIHQDQHYQWGLLENPQRLKILTIDALCAQLNNRMPIQSGFGVAPRVTEDPMQLYQQAVREVILHSTPIELLKHLDNNTEYLSELCAKLLSKRDQWLPYLIYTDIEQLREKLNDNLAQLALDILKSADAAFPNEIKESLVPLLNFAADQLASSSNKLADWLNCTAFPTPSVENLASWRQLTEILLNKDGEWRKKITITEGFPPKTAEKKAVESIINQLNANEMLRLQLQEILLCPPTQYSEEQWRIIQQLLKLLPLLTAQLQLIFQQNGEIDFIEMSLCASRALGEEQQPTDLALALDHQIRHLLIDEFQDTSVAQCKLLEKLLLGWEPDDGRSIFLVGDPMQSIYRFRNAEVGLFLRTMTEGIQNIRLTSLQLLQNFRSGEKLIAWYNQIFPHIFSSKADLASGAVPYTPTLSAKPQLFTPPISCYRAADSQQQAQKIVQIIQQCQTENPDGKIALLVRSRTHLTAIIPVLQVAQINFQAIEIDPLAQRSEIQDLAALTRALHHRTDRIAWLAVLRAPYCGLILKDIQLIAEASENKTIYESLLDFLQLNDLSDDGRQRLQRVVPVLSQSLAHRGRTPVAEWVENTWLALGGPAGLSQSHQLINARSYFDQLEKLTQKEAFFNSQLLETYLAKLYAAPQPLTHSAVQIMTIHKAKGLEFDHVILPELQREAKTEDSALFLWTERVNNTRGSGLIFAPIKGKAAKLDPTYDYLRKLEQKKLTHEMQRLLYVAVTRAKQSLHLLTVIPSDEDILLWKPTKRSFLQMLWPYFREHLTINSQDTEALVSTEAAAQDINHFIERLASDWQPPNLNPYSNLIAETAYSPKTTIKFNDKTPAIIGTIMHEVLAGYDNQSPLNEKFWQRRLQQVGIPIAEVTNCFQIVKQAIHNMLEDPRGQWILSAQHHQSKNEYALSAVINHKIFHVVLDRTFIDKDDNRWIIDYKTGDNHLENIQGYLSQLQLYAKIFALQESRPIYLGIYFPLTSEWHEWQYQDTIVLS